MPTGKDVRAVVVIPVFNPGKVLVECLKAIRASSIQVDVVVVDDGSSDGWVQQAVEQFPAVVVHGDGNLWWSGGMNKGVRRAEKLGATHIIALNHDCHIESSTLERLIDQGTKSAGAIVGSKVLDSSKPDQLVCVGGYIENGMLRYRGSGELDEGQHDRTVATDWLPGYSLFFSVDVFNRLGGFDDRWFPQYFGDVDFVLRAAAISERIEVSPESRVWNDRASTGLAAADVVSPRQAWRLLTSRRSPLRLDDNVRFYWRHRRRLVLRDLVTRLAPVPLGLKRHFSQTVLRRSAI